MKVQRTDCIQNFIGFDDFPVDHSSQNEIDKKVAGKTGQCEKIRIIL
jgi:hypothetical protein